MLWWRAAGTLFGEEGPYWPRDLLLVNRAEPRSNNIAAINAIRATIAPIGKVVSAIGAIVPTIILGFAEPMGRCGQADGGHRHHTRQD